MAKITTEHPLVRAKIAAGLHASDAIEVAERQIAHDEALEAAAEKAAKKTKSGKADDKGEGDDKKPDPKKSEPKAE